MIRRFARKEKTLSTRVSVAGKVYMKLISCNSAAAATATAYVVTIAGRLF